MKKSKRQYRSERTTQRTEVSQPTEFNPDYSLVIKDLRRIGILAGSFVGILILLSFFIR